MTVYVKGSSSITRIELHVSFKTKYCHRAFDNKEFRERCEQLFMQVAEEQKVTVKELGFDGDHVHMIWVIKVWHRVDQLAKSFKGTTGRKLLHEFPNIKREYFWDSGLWSGVIFGDSVGKDPEQMGQYVRNQGRHAPRGVKPLASFVHATSL